jgi:hypothetical protein
MQIPSIEKNGCSFEIVGGKYTRGKTFPDPFTIVQVGGAGS